jgi:hypothetical protein
MSEDWREARIDRLTERVDRIERERREERQRSFERTSQVFLWIVWLMNAAIIALAIAKAAG